MNGREFVPTPLKFAIGFIIALATLGCSDQEIADIPVAEPLQVVIDRGAFSMCRGTTDTISAGLHGDPGQTQRAVHFETRDSSILRIRWQSNADAAVEGTANGITRLIAFAVAQPEVADSLTVNVGFCTTPTPAVTILSLSQSGTNSSVDTASVSGVIDVHLELYALPDSVSVALRIGSQTAGTCPSITRATRTVVCSLNTAATDATGNPTYPNGTYKLSAVVVKPSGVIVAITSRNLVFNNP